MPPLSGFEYPYADYVHCNHDDRRQQCHAPGAFPDPERHHDARQGCQKGQRPVGHHPGVDIHISRALKDAVVGIEQPETVQIKTGGDNAGEDPHQDRQMPANLRIYCYTTLGQGDAAFDIVHGNSNSRGCQQHKTREPLEQLHEGEAEQVKADILAEDRIRRSNRDPVHKEQCLLPLQGAPLTGKESQNHTGQNPQRSDKTLYLAA